MEYLLPIVLVLLAVPFQFDSFWDYFKKASAFDIKKSCTNLADKLQSIAKPRTLKRKVRQLDKQSRDNIISQSYKTMSKILYRTGEQGKIKQMNIISAICGLIGVLIALKLQSFLLLPILGIGLALLPMWLTKFKAFRFHITVVNELSVVLSVVTNSYMRNEKIVQSIEENLEYMNPPIKQHFEWFVNQYKNINPNINQNLEGLKNRIDDKVFALWVDTLIICQKDIKQKYSLNAIVEQYTNDKELLNLLSAEISAPIRTFILVCLLSTLAFPLTVLEGQQFQMGNLLDVLFKSLGGQCIIVGYVLSLLYGLNVAIDLSTKL